MPWDARARRRVGVLAIAILPEVGWVVVSVCSVLWGWVARSVITKTDACSDRRPFALALAVQVVLLVAAIALTFYRGARLRISGGVLTMVLGGIVVLSGAGLLVIWLSFGTCWSGFTF